MPRRPSYRHSLAGALRGERWAYGFTLTVWGTGALLTAEEGRPGIADVAGYLGGFLLVVAVAIFAAAGGPGEPLPESGRRRPAISAVHLLAVAAAVSCGAAAADPIGNRAAGYFLGGVAAAAVLQLAVGLELFAGSLRARR